jgi:hypothetical protein
MNRMEQDILILKLTLFPFAIVVFGVIFDDFGLGLLTALAVVFTTAFEKG